MSIFDSTPVTESPETGHEEETAEVEMQEETAEIAGEEETTEEISDETVESDPNEGHSEELLAGKYKSVDDLVKGYKELHKQFTQARMQNSQTQQQPIQQQTAQQQQQYDKDPNEIIWDALQRDPMGTLNYLIENAVQQRTAPLIEEREVNTFTRNFEPVAKQYAHQFSQEGAMDSYIAKVHEIADEFGRPELKQNPTPRMMKMAAEELWGDSKAAIYQKGVQDARQQQDAARRAKQGVAVQTSKKPQTQPKSEEDLIREGILNAGVRRGIFG